MEHKNHPNVLKVRQARQAAAIDFIYESQLRFSVFYEAALPWSSELLAEA